MKNKQEKERSSSPKPLIPNCSEIKKRYRTILLLSRCRVINPSILSSHRSGKRSAPVGEAAQRFSIKIPGALGLPGRQECAGLTPFFSRSCARLQHLLRGIPSSSATAAAGRSPAFSFALELRCEVPTLLHPAPPCEDCSHF
jgi:hypothetical protein